MAIDLLIKETEGLSEDKLMEVVRFVRFIKLNSIDEKNNPVKTRKAGKYRGQGWMADDFDAPLEDFKEYM